MRPLMFAAKLLSVLYGNYTTLQALSNLIQSKIRKIDMRRKTLTRSMLYHDQPNIMP